jgi:DNA repair protein RadC
MTERIMVAADAVGVVVHDHLVIGKSSEVSFRSEGLI